MSEKFPDALSHLGFFSADGVAVAVDDYGSDLLMRYFWVYLSVRLE